MFEELGGLFGWLIILSFVGTILNYFLKFINKRYMKKISMYPQGKKYMRILMNVFISDHKYFGLATASFILLHFIIQFTKFGLSITGCIAAITIIVQVLLGVYANIKKRPRKGIWFITHRVISVLIILFIIIHLIIPK